MAKRSFFNLKLVLNVVGILLIIGLAASTGFFYKKYNDLKNSSPDKIQQQQTDAYIKAVGKLYSLPTNEAPDVATVKDKEALKKQYPFFDQAENGDVVLIYKNAKLAILYRPSTKQLIKVGPVNVQNGLTIKVVGKSADRAAVEKALTDNKLAFTDTDPKATLSGITVVDAKGSNGDQATKLAQIVGGKVGTLPAGEEQLASDVDLVVYVGPVTTP